MYSRLAVGRYRDLAVYTAYAPLLTCDNTKIGKKCRAPTTGFSVTEGLMSKHGYSKLYLRMDMASEAKSRRRYYRL